MSRPQHGLVAFVLEALREERRCEKRRKLNHRSAPRSESPPLLAAYATEPAWNCPTRPAAQKILPIYESPDSV